MLRRCAAAVTSEVLFLGESHISRDLDELRQRRAPDYPDRKARHAQALLRVGRTREATEIYDELLEDLRSTGDADAQGVADVELARALAYLRLGEQENCVDRNTCESCLFPIAGRAVHKLPQGSQFAAKALTRILERDPENLPAKWLLNIAHMTLGTYPGGVPPAFLIPEWRYRPDSHVAPFINSAGPLGVAVNGTAGGCVVDDFDGDGSLDILASSAYPIDGPGGQLRFFRNNGDGSFRDVTAAAGLDGIRGGLNLIQADYTNNGFPDVYLLRGAWHSGHGQWPNTLLRNNGDGTFTDTTVNSGLLSFHPTQAAAWGDFDSDGWVDLFVGHETGAPELRQGAIHEFVFDLVMWGRSIVRPEVQGHLFHNQGNGAFVDVYARSGIDVFGWVKGATWGDYDRDGRIDLYVSRLADSNCLFRNEGPNRAGTWTFSDVSHSAEVTDPVVSFATLFWDYDNDGWLDLFVAGYPYPEVTRPERGLPLELNWSNAEEVAEFLGAEPRSDRGKPRLYRNNGNGTFTDVTEKAGLYRALSPMGANFGDFDNDGFLDIYLGTGAPPFDYLVPNRLFRNVNGERFDDVTLSANVGHLQKGHGVAFGDVDHDGDQDIYVVMGGAFLGDTSPNALFENPGYGRNWITLKLEGTTANRSAIGADVRLTIFDGTRERTLHRTVSSGGSFGASSLQLEVGLAGAEEIRGLEIVWPDHQRTRERFEGLTPNRAYLIRQGEGVVRPLVPRDVSSRPRTRSKERSEARVLRSRLRFSGAR